MIPSDFKDFFIQSNITEQQSIISSLLSMTKDGSLSDTGERKVMNCPHCKSERIRANGRLKSVQRYFCNSCSKNFSETTGKFWFSLKKKDKMNRYLYCLLSGYSIRKSAKETGISIQTSFDWRHKLLASFDSVRVDGFEGIVESDDLFFAYSEKGNRNLDRKPKQRGEKASKPGVSNEKVAVIATCDRTGNKDFEVVTRGRISKKNLDKVLAGKLDKIEVLCSDGHRSYTAFSKDYNIVHKKFNASKGQRATQKIYHVQNVNNMDMRLRKFMDGFNGVATKYLQNYLNWFAYANKLQNSKTTLKQWFIAMLISDTTYSLYEMFKDNAVIIRT